MLLRGILQDEKQSKVSLIDIENAAEEAVKQQILRELDIANEVYFSKYWGAVHYNDLMSDIPDGTTKKNSLTAWLEDVNRKDSLVRPGIITLYKIERVDQFTGDIWNARMFCDFVNYTTKKLVDVNFIKDKSKVNEFAYSIQNWEWFWRAMSVSALKLLERSYRADSLKSDIARGYMGMVFRDRMYFQNVGKIVGKSTKNHESPPDLYCQIKKETQSALRDGFNAEMSISIHHDEYVIFKKWESYITRTLATISRTAIPPTKQSIISISRSKTMQLELLSEFSDSTTSN